MAKLTTRWGTHEVQNASFGQSGGGLFQNESVVCSDDGGQSTAEPQDYAGDSLASVSDTEDPERSRSQLTVRRHSSGTNMCLSTTPLSHTRSRYASRKQALATFPCVSSAFPAKAPSITPLSHMSSGYAPREQALMTNPWRSSIFPSEPQYWQRGVRPKATIAWGPRPQSRWYDEVGPGAWNDEVAQGRGRVVETIFQSGNRHSYDFQQQTQGLAISLARLSKVDSRYIVVVRKTYRLGASAQKKLFWHFAQYGIVADVLTSHDCDAEGWIARRRVASSGLGFVIMQQPEMVSRAIAQREQVIGGVHRIVVEAFVPRRDVQYP